jgi:hypothetical protein
MTGEHLPQLRCPSGVTSCCRPLCAPVQGVRAMDITAMQEGVAALLPLVGRGSALDNPIVRPRSPDDRLILAA